VREANRELRYLTEEEFDEYLRPERMTASDAKIEQGPMRMAVRTGLHGMLDEPIASGVIGTGAKRIIIE